jgi:D-glycero-beta-D-manno-heptose 1-phosphate adenylyltransferase
MKLHFQHVQLKIKTTTTIQHSLEIWRNAGEKIVFTNGCFDILHYGHLHYLAAAKDLGHRLIVGLNSTASISRLKGPHRPINDELTRVYTLASLQFIDAVIVFEEDTPLDLIVAIVPDILVKGGDWQPHQIVGSEEVIKKGGSVRSLPFVDGYSTTNIEQKIINQYKSGLAPDTSHTS